MLQMFFKPRVEGWESSRFSKCWDHGFGSENGSQVMNRLLRRFYRSKDNCNAISIGDGLAERNGLKAGVLAVAQPWWNFLEVFSC